MLVKKPYQMVSMAGRFFNEKLQSIKHAKELYLRFSKPGLVPLLLR